MVSAPPGKFMERRLAAILAADVVGYSRLMGANEVGTLASLKSHRAELIDAKIADFHGRIVKLTGDGMLVEFPSVVNAVDCSAQIQREMRTRNADIPQDRRIEFRIGVHLGDIIIEADDIFGDGVNVAARIESIAKPGGVSVSGSVRENVGNRLDLTFADTGNQVLKNIEQPVRVYDVLLGSPPRRAAAPAEPAAAEKPSIVVLPFNNMSGDPEQEYFSDGITEDLITDLSKITGLFVIGRNTAFLYKGKPVQLQQVAEELGVKFVLEGSVRKVGRRVRVTGQLIDGSSGGHLWADRYDRDLTDIFAIQDEITQTIVAQLKVKLLPDEKKAIEQAPTENVEAYTYYLRGRQFFHMSTKSFILLARRMFAKAVELDPLYARAYAGMANCDSRLNLWYGSAIPADEILGHTAKALALEPGLAEAHAARGVALANSGRRAEAAPAFEQALALDPDSHEANYFYAEFCRTGGNLERSAALFIRALETQPDDFQAPLLLQPVFASLGRPEEAERYGRMGLKRAEEALRLHPESSRPAQLGACALARLGDSDRAKEWVDRALAIDPDDNNARYNAACALSLLGEVDRAIDLLETWLQHAGSDLKLWFKNDGDLEAIRGHPRYEELLKLANDASASASGSSRGRRETRLITPV